MEIEHPQGQPMLLVRAEYVAITGSLLGAILLAYFEHWHKKTAWVGRTQEALRDDLFQFFSVSSIRRTLLELRDAGWLEMKKHDYYRQNQTWQYRLNVAAINVALRDIESVKSSVSSRQNVLFNLSNRAIESVKSSYSFNRHTDRDKKPELKPEQTPEPALDTVGEGRDSSVHEREDLVGVLVDFGVHEKVAVQYAAMNERTVRSMMAEARAKKNPVGWLVWALRNQSKVKLSAGEAALREKLAIAWEQLTSRVQDKTDRELLRGCGLTGEERDLYVIPKSANAEDVALRYTPLLDKYAAVEGVRWSLIRMFEMWQGEWVANDGFYAGGVE